MKKHIINIIWLACLFAIIYTLLSLNFYFLEASLGWVLFGPLIIFVACFIILGIIELYLNIHK